MSIAFKDAARVPKGVEPEQVMAELDEIEALYGRKSPEIAAEAVLKEPDRFPALRAFCPESPEEAFRDAIRRAMAYVGRIIVEVSDLAADKTPTEIRVLHLVTADDGVKEWQTLQVIASDERRRLELFAELAKDADVFAVKQRNILAEIRRLLGG